MLLQGIYVCMNIGLYALHCEIQYYISLSLYCIILTFIVYKIIYNTFKANVIHFFHYTDAMMNLGEALFPMTIYMHVRYTRILCYVKPTVGHISSIIFIRVGRVYDFLVFHLETISYSIL